MKRVLLILILFFILFSLLYFLYTSKWDGRSRFTVVDLGPPVTVSSFDPATHKGVRLSMPNDLEVDTNLGRGKFPAGSLAAAGSRSWASESVSNYLGIFITGEISQLKWVDRFRWWWTARQIEWKTVDLVQAGLVKYKQTADGERVGELAVNWEQVAPEWFASLVISQEKLAVTVVNTTSVTGLAALVARTIEISGMKVIEISNSPHQIDKCEIVTPLSLKKSVGVQLMKKTYNCQWREGDKLTLFFGRDFTSR